MLFHSSRRKKEIVKPFEVYKNYKSALVWSIIVTLTVGFANIFTIIQPLTSENKDYVAIFQISGPIIFGFLAWLIYRRYENNVLKNKFQILIIKLIQNLKK